jgi:putative ATP-binding cassette transporter
VSVGLPAMSPEERRALYGLAGAAALQGLGMSGVVILANLLVSGESVALRVIGGLINLGLVVGLGALNRRILPRFSDALVERINARRVRVADRMRATPLRVHERHPELSNAVNAEFDQLDNLPSVLATLGVMTATISLSTLFIAQLSKVGLLVWLIIVAAMVIHHRHTRAELGRVGPTLAGARRRLAQALRARLMGHAQLQHDARARDESREDLMALERGGATSQDRLNSAQGAGLAWGEDVLLLGLGVILFRLPESTGLDATTRYQLTTMILSISGMTLVVVGLLMQSRLIVGAYERLLALEAELSPPPGPPPTRAPLAPGPQLTLTLERVQYAYEDGGFCVGPVSLTVRGGELVIIRGGNGSGKTTLMRALAGLYTPTGGGVRLCGERIGADNLAWYQSHITAIFTGHHLFDAPYGLDAKEDEVAALLDRFGLSEVVRLERGRFSRTSLSSGQSKRLAMVVALLERRPVLVFDEWDSHQDPGLRAFYYETLLPELLAQGRVVFAVSHDTRRFAHADHLLHLDGGRMVTETGA